MADVRIMSTYNAILKAEEFNYYIHSTLAKYIEHHRFILHYCSRIEQFFRPTIFCELPVLFFILIFGLYALETVS